MKNLFKKILELKLRFFTKAILAKYQPKVIAVTGSVGKTSTVEAIYSVLAYNFNTRKSFKNYNNEIGIPLTIIGLESGGKSIIRWLAVFIRALSLLIHFDKNYPKILILEMAADHPGDIQYLINFVPVDIGVVTAIAPVHLEFFKTAENIAEEKSKLIKFLSVQGTAVLNYDDELVWAMKEKTKAKILSFGLQNKADFAASEINISHNLNFQDITRLEGISFKVNDQGKTQDIFLPKVLGQHLIYPALVAIVVGAIFNLSLETIAKNLKKFQPPAGRMRLIKGIKNTLLIDDSYNSSPLAVKKALYQLNQINLPKSGKKYAVLGDMLELGSYTELAHQEIGEAIVEYGVNFLITVGEMSRDITRGAVAKGFAKADCFHFKNSVEAGKFLQDRINEGDLILIKGSQGMRMERAVKEIMAEPDLAADLLVRQDESWKR